MKKQEEVKLSKYKCCVTCKVWQSVEYGFDKGKKDVYAVIFFIFPIKNRYSKK